MAKSSSFGEVVGREYMEGKISIADVERILRSNPGRDMHEGVRNGALSAQHSGNAVASRVQPKQSGLRFGPLTSRPRGEKKGTLATRPEHTRYKAPVAVKETPKAKAERHAKHGLNEYEVKSQRKKDLKILLDKHAKGGYGVKVVKAEAKAKAAGAARKNVVYNETKHKFVGKNRIK